MPGIWRFWQLEWENMSPADKVKFKIIERIKKNNTPA
jgi:hypothetical protein